MAIELLDKKKTLIYPREYIMIFKKKNLYFADRHIYVHEKIHINHL